MSDMYFEVKKKLNNTTYDYKKPVLWDFLVYSPKSIRKLPILSKII